MQKLSKETKRLLYPYEVLRARFDIRDFFLKMLVKQIYEQTGQTLSLVRLQMSMADESTSRQDSGDLLEQMIRDLRSMSKSFFPDENTANERSLFYILESAYGKIFTAKKLRFSMQDENLDLSQEDQLIIVKILLDALISIRERNGSILEIAVNNTIDTINFIISYLCEQAILFEDQSKDHPYLSIISRVELINGSFNQKTLKTGHHQLILQLSKND